MISVDDLVLFVIVIVVVFLTIITKKLTKSAAMVAGILALIIWVGAGFTGVAMLATFFVCGTVATSWGAKSKRQIGVAEQDHGRRTTSQVLANGGMAGILSILAIVFPVFQDLFVLMMAGAFASATADTLSSELGNLYGTKYYNILTFRKDARGLDGVISAEGTLIGVLGTMIMAVVYATTYGFSTTFFIICIAGTIGNLMDSVLGATVERRHLLNNDTVNFINTVTGALTALGIAFM